MQTKKFLPEGKQIMPETRFTEFAALSVDLRVRISQFGLETYDRLFLLPMTLLFISFIFDILHFQTSFGVLREMQK